MSKWEDTDPVSQYHDRLEKMISKDKKQKVGKPVSQFAVGRKEAKKLSSPPSKITKAVRGVTADAIKHYEVAKQITIPQGVRATKSMGAGLLKDIKRKMMKHLPGKLKKTY